MWSKIKIYCIVFAVGLLAGGAVIGAIGSGYYNRKIDAMSNTIDEGKNGIRQLQILAGSLLAENSGFEERIERLSAENAERDRQAQARLDEISNGFRKAAEAITGAGDNIQGVIETIELLKGLIKNIQ